MIRWSNFARHTTVLFLVLAVGLALVLFSVKYQVQDLEDELTRVNRAIDGERRALHVLDAEWSYLTDPDRLRRLAKDHLSLAPLAPHQLTSFDALPYPSAGEEEPAARSLPKGKALAAVERSR